MSCLNKVQAKCLKKRISILVLSLFLFTSFLTPVFATQTVVPPTKSELLKAIMLRLVTSQIELVKTSGDVFYNLANLDTLDQNYPAFTNYINGTDTFNNITDGIDGALLWNNSAKTYYKDIFHDFAYSLFNRNKVPPRAFGMTISFPALNSYIPFSIPRAIGFGFSFNSSTSGLYVLSFNSTKAKIDLIGGAYHIIFEDDLGSEKIVPLVIGGDSSLTWGLRYEYITTISQDIDYYYNNTVYNLPSLPSSSYIVPNLQTVKTFDDVENMPLSDIYKTFPTKEETQQYIIDNLPVVIPPTVPVITDYSGFLGGIRQAIDVVIQILLFPLSAVNDIIYSLRNSVKTISDNFGSMVPMLTNFFSFLPKGVTDIIIMCFGFLGIGVFLRSFGRGK
jgi:hypothetical protein